MFQRGIKYNYYTITAYYFRIN